MKKILIGLIAGVCILTVEANTSDLNYTNYTSLTIPVNEKLDILFKTTINFRDDMSEHDMSWMDLGFEYKTYNWLSLGLNYRGFWVKPVDEWSYENRPHINATLKWSMYGFRLSNCCRFELRDFESPKKNDIRYRNIVDIIPPVRFTRLKITPFVHDEMFYSFNADKLNMNWLDTGAIFNIIGNFKGGLFYRWQYAELGVDWSSINILGTMMLYSF
ncbi:MAG: DUF2490 domain-containing protein [Elusimicrobia bacterium]|nr:DUF2490 domain-containing protein [Elusimicrobiota bacterium]